MSNLITVQDKKSILRQYRMRFITLVFVSMALLAAASCALLIPSLYLTKSSIASLQNKKDSYGKRETSDLEKTLVATSNDINTKLNLFNNSAPDMPLTKNMLDTILSAKSSGVRITMFNYSTNQSTPNIASIQISGSAADRASLLAFSKKLQITPGIINLSVPITSYIADQNVAFTISMGIVMK